MVSCCISNQRRRIGLRAIQFMLSLAAIIMLLIGFVTNIADLGCISIPRIFLIITMLATTVYSFYMLAVEACSIYRRLPARNEIGIDLTVAVLLFTFGILFASMNIALNLDDGPIILRFESPIGSCWFTFLTMGTFFVSSVHALFKRSISSAVAITPTEGKDTAFTAIGITPTLRTPLESIDPENEIAARAPRE